MDKDEIWRQIKASRLKFLKNNHPEAYCESDGSGFTEEDYMKNIDWVHKSSNYITQRLSKDSINTGVEMFLDTNRSLEKRVDVKGKLIGS